MTAVNQKDTEDKHAGILEANNSLTDLSKTMVDMDIRIDTIKNTQDDNGGNALENILSDPRKKSAVSAMMAAGDKEGVVGDRGADSAMVRRTDASRESRSDADASAQWPAVRRGLLRHGQQVASLDGGSCVGIMAGLSQIADLTQPYSTADGKSGYLPALNNTQDKIKAGIAGTPGRRSWATRHVPDQSQPWLRRQAAGQPHVPAWRDLFTRAMAARGRASRRRGN